MRLPVARRGPEQPEGTAPRRGGAIARVVPLTAFSQRELVARAREAGGVRWIQRAAMDTRQSMRTVAKDLIRGIRRP